MSYGPGASWAAWNSLVDGVLSYAGQFNCGLSLGCWPPLGLCFWGLSVTFSDPLFFGVRDFRQHDCFFCLGPSGSPPHSWVFAKESVEKAVAFNLHLFYRPYSSLCFSQLPYFHHAVFCTVLLGRWRPGFSFSWISTMSKSPERLQAAWYMDACSLIRKAQCSHYVNPLALASRGLSGYGEWHHLEKELLTAMEKHPCSPTGRVCSSSVCRCCPVDLNSSRWSAGCSVQSAWLPHPLCMGADNDSAAVAVICSFNFVTQRSFPCNVHIVYTALIWLLQRKATNVCSRKRSLLQFCMQLHPRIASDHCWELQRNRMQDDCTVVWNLQLSNAEMLSDTFCSKTNTTLSGSPFCPFIPPWTLLEQAAVKHKQAAFTRGDLFPPASCQSGLLSSGDRLNETAVPPSVS